MVESTEASRNSGAPGPRIAYFSEVILPLGRDQRRADPVYEVLLACRAHVSKAGGPEDAHFLRSAFLTFSSNVAERTGALLSADRQLS
jgi:hypothetical protein